MPNIYWDSCNFLSYINEMPDRVSILDALLASSASDTGTINLLTSELSKVEVAFGATEQLQRALVPEIEEKIDNLWADPSAVAVVEYHDGIGREARSLIRAAITRGWRLKPNDAIHLATAAWLSRVGISIDEFHTYDHSLHKIC
jgi:predicted nucleic acid-binding protein